MEIRVGDLERAEQRWPRWLPWTITISGAVLAVGAVGVSYYAKRRYHTYAENGMANAGAQDGGEFCDPSGCTLPQATAGANHYANVARYATIPFVLGSAGVVTGAVMMLINRKVTRVPAVEVVAGGDGASASTTWHF